MKSISIKRGLGLFAMVASCFYMLWGCGSESASDGPAADSGVLSFNVAFHDRDSQLQPRAAILECAGLGVVTVEAAVYEADNSYLQSGGPWECETGQGTIAAVPAGGGRTVVVLGRDGLGNIVFRGEKPGINVSAGSDNHTGTIDCYDFVPILLSPAEGGTLETGLTGLEWRHVDGTAPSRYQVIIWESNDLSNPVIDEPTLPANYTPLGLSIGATYYWQVFAIDAYGNIGIGSEIRSLTVASGPVNTSPVAQITSPADGSTYTTNDTITFTGVGNDSEDGSLSGASLAWQSDVDGPIGEGQSFAMDTLSGGSHQITLTATDADGAKGTATVAITLLEGNVPQGTIQPSVLVDGTEITVTWNSLTDAVSYNIYWSTTPAVSTTNHEGKFTVSDQTTFTHTLLTYGTAYHYALTAENEFGENPISSVAVGVAGMEFDWYPTIAYDRAYGVAVAKDGSIYWSGETLGGGTSLPNVNFLIKQAPTGYRYWTQTSGLLHPNDPNMGGNNSIALDDLDSNQNCYITGHTFENLEPAGRDIFIRKYGASGELLWEDIIGTPNSDHAYDLAIYSNNAAPRYDTYITGFVSGAVGSDAFQGATDVVVAKYDKDGTRLWTRTMGTENWDVGYGIATDRYGHPYITGRTWGNLNGQGSGIFVAKYNSDSSEWWTRIIQAEGADIGYGNAIIVDQYANAYITGYVGPDHERNMFLAKYNDAGDALWVKIFSSARTINGMDLALDEQENVYVAGYAIGNLNAMQNQGDADIFVAKFDAYGEPQWMRTFGGPGRDVGTEIVIQGAMCYIAGFSTGGINGHGSGVLDNAFLFQLPLDQ